MFENLDRNVYKEDIIKYVNGFRLEKGVIVEEIIPFCTDTVNSLTPNDIIMSGVLSSDGTLFLKPTSIYFKNNCYVLGHNLIGTVYRPGGHFFDENFEGFTCLTLNGIPIWNTKENSGLAEMYILKCRPNVYSKEINDISNWLEYYESLL